MSLLSTDNRDMAEIEGELRARVEAQRQALADIRLENRRLEEENGLLRQLLEGAGRGPVSLDQWELTPHRSVVAKAS